MKRQEETLWIGEKDLTRDPQFFEEGHKEFQSAPIIETLGEEGAMESVAPSRRDFLRYLGFGIGAATLAASCDIPVKRAIPYVVKSDEIVPGIATYYASSFVNGGDYQSILVKTREGRPIKIEANNLSGIGGGGTTARAQASVLDLYDVDRFRAPKLKKEGKLSSTDWDEVDSYIASQLNANSQIRIVSHTIMSPFTLNAIDGFTTKYPNTKLVMYDPVSASALLDANESDFGMRVVPNYKFGEADYIVSFDADFLGSWISPAEYSAAYASKRKIDKYKGAKISRHVQVESHMSLSGSNADNRILVKPSELGGAIAALHDHLAAKNGGSAVNGPAINEKASQAIKALADELASLEGNSLVVSGSQNVAEQRLINAINHMLGNYGSTIEFTEYSNQRKGSDKAVEALRSELNNGGVDALLIYNCNPAYELGEGMADAMDKAKMKVAMSYKASESTQNADVIAPVSHYLESWGDVIAKNGHASLIQPCISTIFNTRQLEETLMKWGGQTGEEMTDDLCFNALKMSWQESLYQFDASGVDFGTFWDKCLHDGVYKYPIEMGEISYAPGAPVTASEITQVSGSEYEIKFYESVAIGAGQYANNPWLMELPDPVTRTVWGNYLAIPVSYDGDRSMVAFNDLEDGDLVDVEINGVVHTLPVIRQFGQMPGTFALAMGYGRSNSGAVASGIGVNVNEWRQWENGCLSDSGINVNVSAKKGEEKDFSCVQYHHTMGVKGVEESTGETINADESALVADAWKWATKGFQGSLTERSVIRKSHVDDIDEFVGALKEERKYFQKLNAGTLYPGYEELYKNGHHWGMHIDLSACIGCGACAVACMAENNVPVVGKTEVARHHEMTWLRIDRYYYGDVDNPNVVYQPMMCQHCDNAPCENVCPVNATSHSTEGLNQMAYNRCVGTRYCANNCPYKVRRFNWLDYATADIWPANEYKLTENEELPFGADNLTRMVLNPDVTVRSRGVIEKCSFCVQRIQDGKMAAKTEMRTLRDEDVKTACQTACPTGAITFGDMNNQDGELNKQIASDLNYIALEEVNTLPSVHYKSRIHNRSKNI